MDIFAVRKPEKLKGVFVTNDGIKKAKESIKGVSGASHKSFPENQLSEAILWAKVKGVSDNPQMAIPLTKKSEKKQNSNIVAAKNLSQLSIGNAFIYICEKFRKSGFNFVELHLKDSRVFGISLENAAIGELRSNYSNDTEADKVAFSIRNKYMQVCMMKTDVTYVEPFLVLTNASTLVESNNSEIPHLEKKDSINICINLDLTSIAEIKAFNYSYRDKANYNYKIIKIGKEHIDLYKKIEPYL